MTDASYWNTPERDNAISAGDALVRALGRIGVSLDDMRIVGPCRCSARAGFDLGFLTVEEVADFASRLNDVVSMAQAEFREEGSR